MQKVNGLTKRQRENVAEARAQGNSPGYIADAYRLPKDNVESFVESEEGRREVAREQRLMRREPAPELPFAERIAVLRTHHALKRRAQLREQVTDADAAVKIAEASEHEAVLLRNAAAELVSEASSRWMLRGDPALQGGEETEARPAGRELRHPL